MGMLMLAAAVGSGLIGLAIGFFIGAAFVGGELEIERFRDLDRSE